MHEIHRLFTVYDHRLTGLVARLPDWLRPVMQAATLIGQPISVVIVALTVVAVAWTKGHQQITDAYVAGLGGFAASTALKYIFQRARPQTLYAENMKLKSYSFPSGHAYGGLVFYGLLSYLSYEYLVQPWNSIAAGLLGLLVLLIGVSRVYLGAHFPSDVTVGWILAAATLVLIVLSINP